MLPAGDEQRGTNAPPAAARRPGEAPSITLHIDELVLHGFPAVDRYRIGEAAEAELARLLAERGMPRGLPGGEEIGLLNAGTFHVAANATPEAIGVQVARAVYGSLGR